MEQKDYKEMAGLYDEIVSLVKKYNVTATELNFHTRVGVASVSLKDADLEPGETYAEYMNDRSNGEEYMGLNFSGAPGWQPSGCSY